jgi:hypothetical protein
VVAGGKALVGNSKAIGAHSLVSGVARERIVVIASFGEVAQKDCVNVCEVIKSNVGVLEVFIDLGHVDNLGLTYSKVPYTALIP